MSEMKWPIHEECLKILGSSNYIDLVNQKFYNNEIISNILIAQFGFSKVECVDDYIKFDNKELYEQCTLGFNSDVIQQSRKDMVCFLYYIQFGPIMYSMDPFYGISKPTIYCAFNVKPKISKEVKRQQSIEKLQNKLEKLQHEQTR